MLIGIIGWPRGDLRRMDEYTRPATWQDLLKIVELLQKHEVEFVLVGGYALASHGYTRMTVDIDISVNPSFDNSKKWILALSELPDGVTKELIGEEDPFDGDYKHAIRINDEFTIDIMPSVSGVDFQTLANHVDNVQMGDISIPVLSLEGLLLTKQNSIRPKDIADVDMVKKMIVIQVREEPEQDDEDYDYGSRR
jgi:predicted nucleotidyltransferase